MRTAFPLQERLEVSRTTPFARIRFLAIWVIAMKLRELDKIDKNRKHNSTYVYVIGKVTDNISIDISSRT